MDDILQRASKRLFGVSWVEIQARLDKLKTRNADVAEYHPSTIQDVFFLVLAMQLDGNVGRGTDRSKRFRSALAFRGVADGKHKTESKLERMVRSSSRPPMLLEISLLRNFQKYARDSIEGLRHPLDHLALAQHHGLATRLLDWSYSPLVALHFATEKHYGKNGVIESVDLRKVRNSYPQGLQQALYEYNALVPTTEIVDSYLKATISELLDDERQHRLDHSLDPLWTAIALDEENSRVDPPLPLDDRIKQRIESLEKTYKQARLNTDWRLPWMSIYQVGLALSAQDPYFVMFEAPAISKRLAAQASLFSMVSILPQKTSAETRMQEIFGGGDFSYCRIIISKRLKPLLRDILDMIGVNERMLFADLDGISSWLNRHYLPDLARPTS